MNETWLIQRLERPSPRRQPIPENPDDYIGNPFNFGGGMIRGGLSGVALYTLEDCFTFDYMGSAEFEFGAIPKALSHIAASFHSGNGMYGSMKVGPKEVYYLGPKEYEEYIRKLLPQLAERKIRLKERTDFDEAVYET